ncbi:MAG: ribonucleoprotein [Thalassobius sp.]|nr:ribonucleoprotein [Thalassovita sp.]
MKFNIKNVWATDVIENYEGETAYKMSPEMELYSAVVTTSLNNNFYEQDVKRLERLQSLIDENDPEFVAQLAVYAREKMHLRSVPLVLLTELAKVNNGNSLVSKATERVISRADEITELLACYQLANNRSNGTKKLNRLSRQLQKGVAASFNKFDEYQFAKYNRGVRSKSSVSLKDALFIAHPKAKDESQQALFDKIATDNLQVPYTWETELSKIGQAQYANEQERKAAFTAKWEELIESGKLGYMAILRNLRNMLEAEVSYAHIKMVANKLSNVGRVRRSKQLPFRFLSAYRELALLKSTDVSILMNAVEKAVAVSVENMKGFNSNTKVLLASDVSGSMMQSISPRSTVQYYDIGLLLSMLLKNKCERVISGIFGDSWLQVNMPSGNILQNVSKLKNLQNKVGFSTNGHLVINELIRTKTKLDKVMFFTDMQMWNSANYNTTKSNKGALEQAWNDYKRLVAPKAKLYLFDLAGYGQLPIRVNRSAGTYLLAGWSDKVFDMLDALERGADAIDEIKSIEI